MHQRVYWLADFIARHVFIASLMGKFNIISNILYTVSLHITVCCVLKWVHALLFSELDPDLRQSRLLQCSGYVWSNLSFTLIWCAWGVHTTSSNISPEEENAFTSRDPSLLHSQDNWVADRFCKSNADYYLSSCMQIHPPSYRSQF